MVGMVMGRDGDTFICSIACIGLEYTRLATTFVSNAIA